MSKIFSTAAVKPLLFGWGMVLFFVAFNSFGSLMIKMQVQKVGFTNGLFPFFTNLLSSWQTFVGLISISMATGAWIVALAHLELSRAYPVAIGLNLLIVIGMSRFHFQEPLSLFKLMGILLIFTGVIFLVRD